MSFAIRGDIMGDFEIVFNLSKTQVGWIGGAAFWSFGLAILFGGPLVDGLGMGFLLRVAAACHIIGTILTIYATGFWMLFAATLIVGAGNGLVEAVCNPLIATIYPEEKTHKLTLFHAWFPGGIVIGGVLAFLLSQLCAAPAEHHVMMLGGVGLWKIKMALLFVPSFIYLGMIWFEKFPATERLAAGVSFGHMFLEAARRPFFWLIFCMMWFTAATELGPGTWIANIYNEVAPNSAQAGILFLVWGNGLMYIQRQFVSKWAHGFSNIGLLACTAPFAAVGLFLFHYATSTEIFFVAATLMYIGVAFWWPTMLGITSERCPKTGAFGLAFIGATGSISTFFSGPILGGLNEAYGPRQALQIWSILPVVIMIVFAITYLYDRTKGGYKVEKIKEPEGLEAPVE